MAYLVRLSGPVRRPVFAFLKRGVYAIVVLDEFGKIFSRSIKCRCISNGMRVFIGKLLPCRRLNVMRCAVVASVLYIPSGVGKHCGGCVAT